MFCILPGGAHGRCNRLRSENGLDLPVAFRRCSIAEHGASRFPQASFQVASQVRRLDQPRNLLGVGTGNLPVQINAPKALPVYDLLNAGPRHRYALWNGNQQCVVSNCTQAVSRDILCHAIHNLRDYRIVAHVHDEVICDVPQSIPVKEVEEIMSRVPPWAEGLALRADGYSCFAYQKDA